VQKLYITKNFKKVFLMTHNDAKMTKAERKNGKARTEQGQKIKPKEQA